jgi:hypothetical protein
MAMVFIYKIDDAGDYHLVAPAETQERALVEAMCEHVKNPCDEFRVVNPNLGVVEVISARVHLSKRD